MFGKQVALQSLCIHATHATEAALPVTVPERFADRLPLLETIIVKIFFLLVWGVFPASSLVKPLKNLFFAFTYRLSVVVFLAGRRLLLLFYTAVKVLILLQLCVKGEIFNGGSKDFFLCDVRVTFAVSGLIG